MRRLLAILLLAIVASAVHGAAATVGVSARPLGAGSAVVGRCHAGTAPTVTYSYSGNSVTGLTVAGLATACNGGSLRAVVVRADGSALGAGGASTVSNGTVSLLLSAAVPAVDVAGYRLSIVT